MRTPTDRSGNPQRWLDAAVTGHSPEMFRLCDWRALAVAVHDTDTEELAGGLLGRNLMGL
jgi:hypothetical protein